MDPYGYRDQLSIDTPEQVALELPLAGLGSRFLAHLIDLAIQAGTYLVLFWVFVLVFAASTLNERFNKMGDTEIKWIIAGFVLLNFAFFGGYYILFEAFWRGQTPGKSVMKIRVLKDSGRPITFFESFARNLLRLVDSLPGFYVVGIVSVIASRQNKRLGDLVAGTLVVHQEPTEAAPMLANGRTFTAGFALQPAPVPPHMQTQPNFGIEFSQEALRHLSNNDLLLLESYFARVHELDTFTTDRLATELLTSLCARMQTAVPTGVSHRRALEAIAYGLRAVAAYR